MAARCAGRPPAVVRVGVRVGGLGRVVVRPLRRPDPVLVPGQRHPVEAGVAVRPRPARQRLGVALQHHVGQSVAVADHLGGVHPQSGGGRPPGRLLGDPPRQHAGEQEVRQHRHPPRAQCPTAVQPGRHAGRGERHERVLHPGHRRRLGQQPGRPGHLGVGVRVRRAAADQQHRGVRAGHQRRQPLAQQRQHRRVRAERSPVRDAQARVPAPLAGQRRRDVALHMTGRHQHQRHRGQPPGATGDQPGHRLGQRRRGQLDETAGHRCGEPPGDPPDEAPELLGAGLVGRAVPGDQQGNGHRSGSPYRRALTAAAATALPPRALTVGQLRQPGRSQRRLGLDRADVADRQADHQGRAHLADRRQAQQLDQRGGRVADRPHRAVGTLPGGQPDGRRATGSGRSPRPARPPRGCRPGRPRGTRKRPRPPSSRRRPAGRPPAAPRRRPAAPPRPARDHPANRGRRWCG